MKTPQILKPRAGRPILRSMLHCIAVLIAVHSSSSAFPQSTKPIRIGQVEHDSIANAAEVDRFTFNAKDGENFQVTFVPQAHLRLRVFAPNGTVKSDLNAANPIKDIFRARASGRYTIEVRRERSLGQYHVGLERLSQPSPNAKPIATGVVVSERSLKPTSTHSLPHPVNVSNCS